MFEMNYPDYEWVNDAIDIIKTMEAKKKKLVTNTQTSKETSQVEVKETIKEKVKEETK